MIRLEIPQIPVPWAASQHRRGVHFNPRHKEKIAARQFISLLYKDTPLKGYVGLLFEFIFPCPPSASKKKKQKMLNGEIFPTRCDTTNCQKFYEDCLKGIVFEDDRNVVIICAEKKYGSKGLVKIQINSIMKLEEADLP